MWKGKKSYVYDVASKFKDFYVKRIAEGKIPDKDADERIERANLSSTKDILNIYRERIIEYRSRFGDTEFYKNFLKYDLDEKQWQQALKDLALTMPCFLPNQRMNAQEEETLKE